MQGECLDLQKKYKKDNVRRPKAMVATWSDKESDSSSDSEDQVTNIYLMAHEDDSSKVNFELHSITIEKWEDLYEIFYTKYKKLKHENKSLKVKITTQDNLEDQVKKAECIIVENDLLKSKKESLLNKVALLYLDISNLTDKLSSYLHEIDDLKFTLTRFLKGKNTLDIGHKGEFSKRRSWLHSTYKNYTPKIYEYFSHPKTFKC